jgi:hypothetical protein
MSQKTENTGDEDARKGAVEQDRPEQEGNVSLAGQIGHRNQDPLLKANDSDYPEQGQNPEHSGEPQTDNALDHDTEIGCGGTAQDLTPGERQKENQNQSKDDPLAA